MRFNRTCLSLPHGHATQDGRRVRVGGEEGAVKLIRKGRTYPLGHVYEPTMPLFPGNTHALELKTPVSIARQTGNFDFYHGDIGQNGTQFDALGHFGLQPEGNPDFADAFFYNRFRGSEIFSPTGLMLYQFATDKFRALFTQGHLGGGPALTESISATARFADRRPVRIE